MIIMRMIIHASCVNLHHCLTVHADRLIDNENIYTIDRKRRREEEARKRTAATTVAIKIAMVVVLMMVTISSKKNS